MNDILMISTQIGFVRAFVGNVQLPAQPVVRLKNRYMMTLFGGGQRSFHPGRPSADNDDVFGLLRFGKSQRHTVLAAITRVDRTSRIKMMRRRIVTLVAADTGNDIVRMTRLCLDGPIRIGIKTPAIGHQIGNVVGDNILAFLRGHNAGAEIEQQVRIKFTKLLGILDVSHMRFKNHGTHLDTGLVILIHSHHDIHNVYLILYQTYKPTKLLKGVGTGHKQLGTHTKLNDKIRPHCTASGLDKFNARAGTIFKAAAPLIVAVIKARCKKLGDHGITG